MANLLAAVGFLPLDNACGRAAVGDAGVRSAVGFLLMDGFHSSAIVYLGLEAVPG